MRKTLPALLSSQGGFGLVDLLLTVTLLAILAAVPVLALDVDEYRLDAQVGQLVADVMEAQQLAIETRIPFGVRFDTGMGGTAFILGSGLTPGEDEAALRANPNLTTAEVERLLAARTSATSGLGGSLLKMADFGGSDELVFDAAGIPTAGGMVEVARGRLSRRIRVQSSTGRVVVTVP